MLEREPRHGYELKQDHDRLFRDGPPLRFGQIYATLARLVRDGRAEPLGTESGQGPDRKRYAITEGGRAELELWLATPDPPDPHLRSTLFAKVVLSLGSGRDAEKLLTEQRALHLERMRELTRLRRGEGLAEVLLMDLAIFHLDADLRWLDLTTARLDELAKELTT